MEQLRHLTSGITDKDIKALRKLIGEFARLQAMEDVSGLQLPDEEGYKTLKAIIDKLRKKEVRLSEYSSKGRIKKLPSDLTITLITLGVVHDSIQLDTNYKVQLLELKNKIETELATRLSGDEKSS